MRIGEVCLNTNDVVKLANFYKQLLRISFGALLDARNRRKAKDNQPEDTEEK